MNINETIEKEHSRQIQLGNIARWKTSSRFESLLAKMADKSSLAKRLYVIYYKIIDREYHKVGEKMAEKCIATHAPNKNRIEKKEILIDAIYSLHRFGCAFNEYFLFDFQNLNASGRKHFITDKNRHAYYGILNNESKYKYFDQKNLCFEKFKKYYSRECLYVNNDTSTKVISDFVAKHKKVVFKPVAGSCGSGIRLFDIQEKDAILENETNNILSKTPLLIEECLENHKEIKRLAGNCLSTVRMPVIRSKGKAHIFQSCIRIGRQGSVVDNIGAGGLVALIDINSGVIVTRAFDKNNKSYLRHPETDVLIPGFQIPMWNEALDLAKKLSSVVPDMRYVGWDIALTDRGWVMIEGNPRGEFYFLQYPDKQGRKNILNNLISEEIQ